MSLHDPACRSRPGVPQPRTAAARRPRPGSAAFLLSLPVHLYRYLISPLIGPRCRFLPTCSDYALDALATHGAGRGLWLALRRVARCHPWGGSGYDPVPPASAAPARRPTSAAEDHPS